MRYTFNPLILFVLNFPAQLYRLIVFLRNRLYDRNIIHTYRSTCAVISVGNITVGGTGKTPFVIYLCNHFVQSGKKVVVVSRGYRGTQSGRNVFIVADGRGQIFCSPEECGDEPYLLALSTQEVPVLISRKRSRAVDKAVQEFSPDIIMLDDGYQHRAVNRDIDILLIDATDPFGNYRLIPAGILREPIRNLNRADIVVITRAEESEEFITLERIIRTHNRHAHVFKSGHIISAIVMPDSAVKMHPSELKDAKVFPFCAIGNPEIFTMDLEHLGARILGKRFYRDHHRYSRNDLKSIERDALSAGAEMLITTRKDMANMSRAVDMKLPLCFAELKTVVYDDQRFIDTIEEMLAKRRG